MLYTITSRELLVSLLLIVLLSSSALAQQGLQHNDSHAQADPYRGIHTIEATYGALRGVGGNLRSENQRAMRLGYKYAIWPQFNVGITYNKFNLALVDGESAGYMSFDLNMEYLILPYKKISPFIFAGGGYNAPNSFDTSAIKYQSGGGLEVMIASGLGVKIMADYNYFIKVSDADPIIGGSGAAYWRYSAGVNVYFGTRHKTKKITEGDPTVIKSNPIIKEN